MVITMAPIKLGEGLTSKIILTGEPLLINKDLQELRLQMGIQQIGVPAASYLGVPIPVGDGEYWCTKCSKHRTVKIVLMKMIFGFYPPSLLQLELH